MNAFQRDGAGGDSSTRLIRHIYIRLSVFFAVLACFILVTNLIMVVMLLKARDFDRTESLGAEQHVLTQRILLLSQHLAAHGRDGPDGTLIRKQLSAALGGLIRNHETLTGESAALSEDLRTLYFGPRAFVDRNLRQFMDQGRALARDDLPEDALRQAAERLQATARGTFMDDLGRVIQQYHEDSEGQMAAVGTVLVGVAVLFPAILGFSIFGFFGPMIRDLKAEATERSETLKVISDSVSYAARIQRSILPHPDVLEDLFTDHFVLWEPRDLVGGDIYWHRAWSGGALVIMGDCTGHGVPGAFMTLVSNGALDEAYLETPPGDVAALLQRMHQLIQASMRQDAGATGEADDGIELGACFLNRERDILTFAGAHFDLFLQQDGVVTAIKGDKRGLGFASTPYDIRFRNHVVTLTDGMTFYMTTDGLVDQVGGDKRMSFGKSRFKALIATLADVPLRDQKPLIRQALLDYQDREVRRDDVSVIGFKVRRDGGQPNRRADKPDRRQTDRRSNMLDRRSNDRRNGTAVGLRASTPVLDCRLIDEDHQKLYALVGRMEVALMVDKDDGLVLEIMEELIAYTEWHFRHEERLMQEHAFPYFEDHRIAHQILIGQVLAFDRDIREGQRDIRQDLIRFLLSWLETHILGEDKKLADFFNGLDTFYDVTDADGGNAEPRAEPGAEPGT